MSNKKIIFVKSVVVGALVISVILNLYYYVSLSRENENILNNMRARALASYGGEVAAVAYFLEEYLETLDLELIDKEVSWGLWRAELEAEICIQGLSKDSGLMYYELRLTAFKLRNYFDFESGYLNITNVETISQLLYALSGAFFGFEAVQNKDPLEVLSPSGVNKVINYCQQIQEIVG